MKAVWIAEFGRIDSLEIREVPAPADPGPGEVIVNVRAAGLNRADLLQALGKYPPPPPYSPNIPGLEFAGVVADVGRGVSRFKLGDSVFGITAGEAQAEYLKIDERLISHIPASLDLLEAAAVPEAFITAHDALFSLGRLAKDETLLIHAVGSGVGLAALQLAKQIGVSVIGTSRSSDKLERCTELGLDAGILTGKDAHFSSAVKAATDGHGADVVLDLVGGGYFAENLLSLALKGRLLLVGLMSGRMANIDLGLVLQKRLSIIGTVLRSRSAEEKGEASAKFVSAVVPLFEKGQIQPVVDRIFPAAEVVEAYEYLAGNDSFGKVIVKF